MIEYTFDTEHAILYVQPKSSLEENDFVQLAKTVDPFIEKNGDLAGIIIQTPTFPGWKSLGAMAKHFRFVVGEFETVKRWIMDRG
ncbi:MAG: hypothetical protein H6938_03660 [Burkholderiales bacterium]|nr:hypothetical protein [Burkholderiales bacterium]